MTGIKKTLLYCFIALISITNAEAQWKQIKNSQTITNVGKTVATVEKAAIFSLDKQFLNEISMLKLSGDSKNDGESKIISLPLPDGKYYTVSLHQTALFHPGLLKKYPGIQSFTGYGIGDAFSLVKCSIGEDGFHGMIISPKYGNIFIDPLTDATSSDYIVYNKVDYSIDGKNGFECTLSHANTGRPYSQVDAYHAQKPDCTFRKYRLALACTGEYAAFHGGTIAKVLSAMNTTMTRVSGVYERDLAVSFEIIPDNDKLVFLNGQTDPYSNNNGGAMLYQNQQTVDNLIGEDNYDIGHVFSTGGGGIASLQSVCNSGFKAQGVTGSSAPVGDPFDIDYVCHEMGHQFNAYHTFNNACGGNIAVETAFEPGSGTTIMGYAGVCDPNVQFNSDAYFHSISLSQISTYITKGFGSVCPVKTNLNNTAPTVSAGGDKIIPKSTAFELTATASDADGDSLTYCWEQMNNELVIHPPLSTYSNGPSFRSFYPTASPTRVFPQITTIINNSTSKWEVLPAVARNLDFTVTVRDNHNGGGCFGTDEMSIKVDGSSGPFLVTKPNTALVWTIGNTENITWDVAGTDQVPVNCFAVDIYLSVDGGYTYPYLLASNVPNNGNYSVQVPNYPGTKNRIKVKGYGNVFFDISNTNFTISQPNSPSVYIGLDKNNTIICTDTESEISILATIEPLAGFNEEVSITVDSLPPGVTANISPQTTTLPANVAITLGNLTQLQEGSYSIFINIKSNTLLKTVKYSFLISKGAPGKVVLQNVTADSKNISVKPQLSWDAVPGTKTYHVVVAKDYAFTDKIFESDTKNTNINVQGLEFHTVYFWKVNAKNECGDGSDSDIRAFQTINQICNEYVQKNPVIIPDNKVFDGNSTIHITDSFNISELSVSVKAQHTYLVDLKLDLLSPNNKTITLLGNVCPGAQDVDAVFSDKGVPISCNAASPAVSGLVKPSVGALSEYQGNGVSGTWTLKISDNYPQDGGQLQSWNIRACTIDSTTKTPLLTNNNTLYLLENTSSKIDQSYLQTVDTSLTPANIRYFITKTTQNGQLRKGLNVLKIGDWFTQTDINNKLISYKNTSFDDGLDGFGFYVLDINGNWKPEQQFNIVIFKALKAEGNANHIECHGEKDGTITIHAENGIPPYEYSLNGSIFISDNTFTDLAAGSYDYQVKDLTNTIIDGTVTVTEPDSLILDIIKAGYNLTLSISGGVPPFLASIDGVNFSETLNFTNLSMGNYLVTVKDANDCVVSDTVSILTSVNNVDHAGLSIFPLPADAKLNIQLKNIQVRNISITDVMGRRQQENLHTYTISDKILINTSSLPSGMYILMIETDDTLYSTKLIIQH